MTLALALLACIAIALLCAAASRLMSARLPWITVPITLVAVLAPLLALVLIMRGVSVDRSTDSFQVVGQFAPLNDSLALGGGTNADVSITALAPDTNQFVWIVRDRASGARTITTLPGMPVVYVNGVPVNAARTRRVTTITLTGRATTVVRLAMPRWPLSCLAGWERRCTTREISVVSGVAGAGAVRKVRLSSTPVTEAVLDLPAGSIPEFSIVRTAHGTFVSSVTPNLVRVNGEPLPQSMLVRESAFSLGRGADTAMLRFSDDSTTRRQVVRYLAPLQSEKWAIGGNASRSHLRVQAGAAPYPGTVPVLDFSAWGLGRSAQYEGVLVRENGNWTWSRNGVETSLPPDSTHLFPSANPTVAARGHFVRLARVDRTKELAVIAALWMVGAIVLALNAVQYNGAIPALRILVLGLAYTLVFLRSVLALRVTAAPPSLPDAQTTLTVLLVVLPVCVVLVERWSAFWSFLRAYTEPKNNQSTRRSGYHIANSALLRNAALRIAILLAAPVVVLAANNGNLSLGILAGVVISGFVGLMAIQQLLIPSSESGDALASPLAMLDAPRHRELGLERLFRAVAILFLLVAFYLELFLARRVPALVVAAVHLALVAAVWSYVVLRERVMPRYEPRWLIVRATALSIGAGLLVFVLVAEVASHRAIWFSAIAAALAVGLAFAMTMLVCLPLALPVRGGSVARREVLPPIWAMLLPAAGVLLSGLPVVRRFGITLGFALAIAATLVLVRVLALFWHQDARERARMLLGVERRRVTLRDLTAVIVLCGSLLAGHFLVDRGLLQLIFGALVCTLFIGAAGLGRKALLVPLALTITFAAVWLLAVRVTPHDLQGGKLSMTTPRMRQAAASFPDELQLQLPYAQMSEGREIVNTLIQQWGMSTHAAQGGVQGDGFFSLDFSSRVIGAREAVTDNVFSVFILSEHGFLGGVAVLLTYVMLAYALLFSGWTAARSFAELPRAFLLTACAAFIAVPALYMIGANVGTLALTGQNLPLLGLRSGADVALFVWILMLAVAALPRANRESVAEYQQDQEYGLRRHRVRVALIITATAVTVLAALLVAPMWRATSQSIAPFRLDHFADRLRQLVSTGDVAVANGKLVIDPNKRKSTFGSGTVLDYLVRKGNGDPAASYGTSCLTQTPWLDARGDSIDVSSGCTVPLNTGGSRGWQGALTTKPNGTAFSITSNRGTVAIDARSASPVLASCQDTAVVQGNAAELSCGEARLRFDLKAGALQLVARGTTTGITVNGQPISAESANALAAGDVIHVPGIATAIVDSVPRAALALARWRNGEIARVVTPGTSPYFGRLDSLMGSGLRLPDSHSHDDVELTLDAALAARVQAGLDSACAGMRQCSIILVQPESGNILSLSSTVDSTVRLASYLALDPNFNNHRAASLIKPLIATTVLAKYPKLSTLVVQQPQEMFSTAAGWSITGKSMKTPRRGCPGNSAPIGWDCFLPTSNNLFAVTLGFLGAAQAGQNGLPEMEDGATGPTFSIEGASINQRPHFARRGGHRRYNDSPLVKGLGNYFDAQLNVVAGTFDRSLWKPLETANQLKVSGLWQRVSPAIPELNLDRVQFDDTHFLAGFMIGETENKWSNAALVRAASRIVTDKRIDLRLIQRIGKADVSVAAPEGLQLGAARTLVLDGMHNVLQGIGTARALSGRWPPAIRLVAKTGTLDSDSASATSSFMFAGTHADVARGCSVVGVIHVEAFENSSRPVPPGKEIFAAVVLPALTTQGPWRRTACSGEQVPRVVANIPVAAIKPAIIQKTAIRKVTPRRSTPKTKPTATPLRKRQR